MRVWLGALTFEMRGGRKWAKPACGRPLDGRVRPHSSCTNSAGAQKRQVSRVHLVELLDFYAASSDSYPCLRIGDEVAVSIVSGYLQTSIGPRDRRFNV